MYLRLVQQDQLSRDEIKWLFAWKNGMNLSGAKQLRVNTDIIPNYLVLEQLKQDFSLTLFEQHFSGLTAVWRVFLLHILQPETYSIFDQHVYRAFCHLTGGQAGELPIGSEKRMRIYYNDYLPFFNQIAFTTATNRYTIDRALWAFGKFSKQYPTLIKHD